MAIKVDPTMPLQERAAITRNRYEEKERADSHVAFLRAFERALHSVSPLAVQRDQRAVLISELWRTKNPTARSVAWALLALFKQENRGRPRNDDELFQIAGHVHNEITEREATHPGRRVLMKDVYAGVADALRLDVRKVQRAFRRWGWWFPESEAVRFERTQAEGSAKK